MSKRNSISLSKQSKKKRRLSSPSCSFDENALLLDDVSSSAINSGPPSSVGKILSITLKNFMCHDNLKFDFSPDVNFIIGRNGSGKSAVLTGIILALGGKSSATGRFSSLKGFIKTGKQTAHLAVTLCNDGETSYKSQEYGKKIIIERHLTMDGSTYKIKSESGHILHNSKEELDKILDYMKIQVDNPVCILTQENSRSFLDGKNSKEKYKFFFKATELEKLYQNYLHAESKSLDSEKELKLHKEAIPEMDKDIKKFETIVERASKITEYENELVWSHVMQLEKHRDKMQEEYDAIKNSVVVAECKLKLSEEGYKKICSKLDASKNNLNDDKLELKNAREAIADLDVKLKKLNEQRMELKGKLNKTDREIKKNLDEITNLQNSIRDIKEKSTQDVMKEKMRREEYIAKAKQKILELKQDEIELVAQQKDLLEEITQTKFFFHKLQSDEAEINKQKHLTLENLKKLENRMNCRGNVFGPYMLDILKNIERAANQGVFKKKPVGPIAQFVKVKEKEWSFAIEILLGANLLRSFCCDNFQDSAKLDSIIRNSVQSGRYQTNHQIIVCPFENQVHNVIPYKAKSNHPTVFDMIDCSDVVIMNCLIDQKSIEHVLLIKDAEEAMDLMMGNPPQGCSLTILQNGDRIFPAPKFRNYSCKKNSSHLLQVVNQDHISSKRVQYEQLNLEEEAIKKQLITSKQQLLQLERNIRAGKEVLKTTQCAIEMREEEISTLQVVEEIKDINCLQEDLESQYAERERLKQQKNELQQEFRTKSSTYDELHEKILLKKDIHSNKSSICIALQDKIVELERAKENYSTDKRTLENSLQQEKSKVAPIEKDYDEAKESAEVSANTALQVCPRVETTRLPKTIEAVIAETKKILESESNCTSNDMKTTLLDKKMKFNEAKIAVRKITNLTKALGRMVQSRFAGYKEIHKNTGLLVNYDFVQLLQIRTFVGKMVIDDTQGTLTLWAKPKNAKVQCNTRDLSGGERSFVQICLLLALWKCIHMPFRILDEYDVFMDSANRDTSLRLMVHTALQSANTQFIFLSPLKLSSIQNTSKIKIHQMPAPKRSHV